MSLARHLSLSDLAIMSLEIGDQRRSLCLPAWYKQVHTCQKSCEYKATTPLSLIISFSQSSYEIAKGKTFAVLRYLSQLSPSVLHFL